MLTQFYPAKNYRRANRFHSTLIPTLDLNRVAEADTAAAVSDLDKATKL